MEDSTRFGTSSFSEAYSYPFPGMFDFSDKNSLGFVELLGIPDFCPNSSQLFDLPAPPQFISTTAPPSSTLQHPLVPDIQTTLATDLAQDQCSLNPSTPNSSSISSLSNEEQQADKYASADKEEEDGDDDADQAKARKGLKAQKKKKTSQKRQKEPRFAFMTKSEVDHLEDGYRWRKYGQKAVKNSPFPRSYFRCTTASCNVKKRVERCVEDPTVVVTTYEGQHTHQSPLLLPPPKTTAPGNFAMPTTLFSHYQHQQAQSFADSHCYNFGSSSGGNRSFLNERRFCSPVGGGSALLTDHGLLQDIVPFNMLKQE